MSRPSAASAPHPPPLGLALKHWRGRRGLSQLGLALEAGVSARHVSFIESGRTRPSREMITQLATALRLPLREHGDLLEVAGYARQVRETDLDAAALAPARRAITMLLEHHDPLPAVVMDRHWNLIDSNPGASRFFAFLLDGRTVAAPNILRLMFDPEALRPWVTNWTDVASALIRRVHDEAVGGILDARSEALLRSLEQFPEARAVMRPPAPDGAWPLLPIRFAKHGQQFAFFSMVTSLGTPRDVALQGLRIESFFPVDDATRRAVERLPRADAAP